MIQILPKISLALSPELLAATGIDEGIGCRVQCNEEGVECHDADFCPQGYLHNFAAAGDEEVNHECNGRSSGRQFKSIFSRQKMAPISAQNPARSAI